MADGFWHPTATHFSVKQLRNVALRAQQSSSPAQMAAAWTRDWSVTQPPSVATAPTSSHVRIVSSLRDFLLLHSLICIYVHLKCYDTGLTCVLWSAVNNNFEILLQIPVDEQKGS